MVLQRLDHGGIARVAGLQDADGFDHHAALLVGHADHAALGHGRVAQQGVFHLGAAHVVAGGDDHVVVARLVEEVAVSVLRERIARVVPAVLHVLGLARVVEVLAARGADHRELAHGAAWHFMAVVVHHLRGVAGHHLADGAAPALTAGRGNEDVEHLRGADTVRHVQTGRLLPQLARGVGQAFARAHAGAQLGQADLLGKGCHLPVEGGGGVADGHARIAHQPHHGFGRVGLVGEVHAGPGPHRKHQQAAQAKGERQGWRARHDVIGRGLEYMARPGLAACQHVAVGVHGSFGRAGGARGEGHQRDVVRRRGAGRRGAGLALRALQQVGRIRRCVEGHDGGEHGVLRLRGLQLGQQAAVAQCQRGLGAVDDAAQLHRAQQRHGRHRHQPRVDGTQPSQRHLHRVAAAQQHAVAGHQAVVLRQHLGNARGLGAGVAVGVRAVRAAQQGAVDVASALGLVEQRLHQVGLVGDLQLRQVVAQCGPGLGRRQAVVHEVVGLGGGGFHAFTPAERPCR